MQYFKAFAAFWYDFIVGDSWVLAVGAVALLIVGCLLVLAGAGKAAEVLLPLAVLVTLVASLWPLRGQA